MWQKGNEGRMRLVSNPEINSHSNYSQQLEQIFDMDNP
jgi:hypothetical protein